jgi:hypothetical protein
LSRIVKKKMRLNLFLRDHELPARRASSFFAVAPVCVDTHPANSTTAIIKRICFMPATLRLTGSGVNAVGGGRKVCLFLHHPPGMPFPTQSQRSP